MYRDVYRHALGTCMHILVMAYVFMAHIVMAYIFMACAGHVHISHDILVMTY